MVVLPAMVRDKVEGPKDGETHGSPGATVVRETEPTIPDLISL